MATAVAFAVVTAVWCFAQAVTGLQSASAIRFDQGFSNLFGESNIQRSEDDRTVRILLDRSTGSGFISSDLYSHGLFSAKIKLPSDYTAGVVVAFYTSNGDIFEKNHDELDFEFLGNVRGKEWKIQTNVYGNGSTSRGREERYILPFDPAAEAHQYSILWTDQTIIFYVDDTPIREVCRSAAMAGDYPAKPMALYATIWDGSTWATAGGRYKVNYRYAPFVAEFSDLTIRGCRTDPIEMVSAAARCREEEAELFAGDFAVLSPEKRAAMRAFREKQMTYSFCYDSLRYPTTFPDCNLLPSERARFKESGHLKFGAAARRRHRRHGVTSPSEFTVDQ